MGFFHDRYDHQNDIKVTRKWPKGSRRFDHFLVTLTSSWLSVPTRSTAGRSRFSAGIPQRFAYYVGTSKSHFIASRAHSARNARFTAKSHVGLIHRVSREIELIECACTYTWPQNGSHIFFLHAFSSDTVQREGIVALAPFSRRPDYKFIPSAWPQSVIWLV